MAGAVRRRTALMGVLSAAACAVVAPFDDQALAPVRRGEAAAVLLRFVVTAEDGRDILPFDHAVGDDSLGLARGDFDSGGVPEGRIIAARFPSEAARRDGALVLLLAPGYHYLAIQGARRTGALAYQAGFRAVPRWRIAIPERVPLIYAGTFQIRANAIDLMFGDVVIGAVDQAAMVVEDDTGWARMAAARDLPGLPPPVTRLAVRHAGPVLLGVPQR
ncbi:hypothetical protein [Elioraea sp.]|uniref:hypothetical protein n=1 Tax=Elioraea sp. TaxID=2185103 RepID=UPI0025C49D16|nr:hypothetical protein [Elioraea sp.]